MIRLLRPMLAAVGAAALLALSASAASAQVRVGTIDPGMTRAQVEERLGPPKVVRTSGAATYLFYANGCARSCGMDDLVVLEQDAVTDAVFRSPAHRYTGQSSSPAAVAPHASRGAPRTPHGVTPIRSDSAMSASGRGGLVIGGDAPSADGPPPRPEDSRPAARRSRRRPAPAATTTPSRTSTPVRPAGAGMPTTADAATPAAAPGAVTNARNGQRSSTGPVDARAAVKNQGAPLYPAATPVRTPSARTDSSGARVPYQGAQLAPADSDQRTLRRATTIPGQTGAPAPARPDSTRP